jgi:hypothetical protein
MMEKAVLDCRTFFIYLYYLYQAEKLKEKWIIKPGLILVEN